MTAARAMFARLVRAAAATLEPKGFRRRGNTLSRHDADVWAVVRFQVSRDSGSNWVAFTVNLGVAFAELPSVMGWTQADDRPPKPWDCHVSVPIDHVLPDRSPAGYRWLVADNTAIEELERVFVSYFGGPVSRFLDELSTVGGLRRYWLRKADRGAIEDRELRWLRLLDESVDVEALAKKAERAARGVKAHVGPVDFSEVPPLIIETPKH